MSTSIEFLGVVKKRLVMSLAVTSKARKGAPIVCYNLMQERAVRIAWLYAANDEVRDETDLVSLVRQVVFVDHLFKHAHRHVLVMPVGTIRLVRVSQRIDEKKKIIHLLVHPVLKGV